MKDEELRTLLRKRGYRVLELSYTGYTDKKRDELCREIMSHLGKQHTLDTGDSDTCYAARIMENAGF